MNDDSTQAMRAPQDDDSTQALRTPQYDGTLAAQLPSYGTQAPQLPPYDSTQAAQLPEQKQNLTPLLVPLVVGGLIAVGMGLYGRVHLPTGYAIGPAGFSGALAMKAWFTTGAFVLALVQLFSALVMWGRIKLDVPWIGTLHRWSGRVAFLLTLPVAFHCLYALGTQFDVPRVMIHSLLGCFFYGVFTAKMLALPKRGLPGWTLPVLGGLTFTALTGLWLTSSFWFFTTIGIKL